VHCKSAVESKKPTNIRENIADNLTKIFKLGPEVSLRGSPTVSPITAALCSSLFFPLTTPSISNSPFSIYFFALSHAPPALADEIAIDTPEINMPGNKPATADGPIKMPTKNGTPNTIAAGKNISLKDAVVATLMHFSYFG